MSTGFPWAVRILTFIILGSLIICCAVMRIRPRHRKSGLVDFKHFRDPSYMAFVAGRCPYDRCGFGEQFH